MKSKVERVNDSIVNMLNVTDYFIQDLVSRRYYGQISKEDFEKLNKKLNSIKNLLTGLKRIESFENKRITEIRIINLTIGSLIDEYDFDVISAEACKTHNNICRNNKEHAREKLGLLKRTLHELFLYEPLSYFYQFRYRAATYSEEEGLKFKGKNHDNIKFLNENFINVKYNLKSVKYNPIGISEENQKIINKCNRVLESNKYDYDTKHIYFDMKNYVTEFARSEVVIDNLEKIVELSKGEDFKNIRERVSSMIVKYKRIYKENKEKYDLEAKKLEQQNNLKRIEKKKQELQGIKEMVTNSMVFEVEDGNKQL